MNETTSLTRRRVATGWVVVFLAAFALYALTASRGAQWQDSGDRALRIYLHELQNPRGLALVHPLHHWLGRAAVAALPGVEPVLAITLVSALAGALAVANVFGCVVAAVRSLPGAAFGAATLALAHTVWQLSTVTEVYTVSAALFAGECWCLLAFAGGGGRWAFLGMMLLNGLGVANHLQAGLTTPVLVVVAVVAWRGQRIGWVELAGGAWLWLMGTLPYSAMVAAEWMQSGDFAGTLRLALFGKDFAGNVLNTSLSRNVLFVAVAFAAYNFPNLLWPAAVYGIARARAMGLATLGRRALLAGLGLHAVFVLRYNVTDQYMFFLPAYVILCVFGGIGAAAVARWGSARWRQAATGLAVVGLMATPGVYWVTAKALKRMSVLPKEMVHNKPYRDDYAYLFLPWSVADNSVERISREAVALAGEGGLVITEDNTARFAVEYRAARSGGRGVEVHTWPRTAEGQTAVMRRARAKVEAAQAVVLVPLDRDWVGIRPPVGRWARKGDLYVLDTGRVPTSMGAAAE